LISSIQILRIVPFLISFSEGHSLAWGKDGHEAISLAAWEAISKETRLPGFFKKGWTKESIVHLANEPDRWKGPLEPTLKAGQDPEHFFDIEPILDSEIPANRYLALELYRSRGIKPEEIGFLPYAIIENYEKLKAAFREFRKQRGQAASYLERAIIHHAGILGHYVGDGAQPLHITIHHHGWVGNNPSGFTTDRSLHRRFEDEFVRLHFRARELSRPVRPPHTLGEPFQDVLEYLRTSHGFVQRLYELEKKGGFGTATQESKRFVLERLTAASQMLTNLWHTAWVKSGE
jgi:hypothetical protein